jgi:RHS repeat-associated protein
VSFAQTEKQIYGSSLLGIDVTKMEMIGTLPLSNIFTRPLDNKHYTGSNHLDNVLVTFTDRKLPIDADNNGIIDEFWPDIIASNDYMPFGALLTERTFKKGTFPNSFNGKRDDAEIKSQNYGKREYEPETRELGYTVDPITSQYPMLSPYQFASNTPIQSIDLDGLESFFVPEIVKLGLDILPKVTTDLDIEFIPPATEVTPIPPVTPPYPNAPSAPSEAPPATKTETPATPVTPELPWWAYHADGAENQPKDNTQVPYAPKSEEKKTEDNSNKSEETENEQNKHTEKQNKHVEKQKKQAEKQKREKQIQNQESKKHTKNASKSKGDKHTKKRPGENTGGSRNDKKGNKNKKFIKKINPNKYGN